jgi:hypothetical protein
MRRFASRRVRSHPASYGGRLTRKIETIDTPGKRWYFGRWSVYRQFQHRGWRYVQDYVVVVVSLFVVAVCRPGSWRRGQACEILDSVSDVMCCGYI